MGLADRALAARCFHRHSGCPATVVKAGQIPAGDLQSGVVLFAHSKIVGNCGGGGADKCFVCFQFGHGAIGEGQPQADRQLGGRPPGCFLKIPDIAAKAVLHAIAQLETKDIFTCLDGIGQIIYIVVKNMIRVGDIGGQKAAGQFLAVEPEPVKTQAADGELCFDNAFADVDSLA